MRPWSCERMPEVADRKSTRLNSSHVENSYAVFCLKKKIMKDSLGEARELYEHASPMSRVHAEAPPFCIIHGDRDILLLVGEARRFAVFFFFNDTATTEIYTLSLHDALPI